MGLMADLISLYKQHYLDSRRWWRLVLLWFGISVLVGGLTFFVIPDLLDQILQIFEDKFGPEPALDFKLVLDIFFNNLQVSLVAIFGGLLVGLGPFVIVASNGFILGYLIVSVTALTPGNPLYSLGFLAVGLIPHGVFEIPAFLFASAVGLALGIEWLKKENYGHRWEVFKKNLGLVVTALPVIIILLFVAALIEVYGTGQLLDLIIPK